VQHNFSWGTRQEIVWAGGFMPRATLSDDSFSDQQVQSILKAARFILGAFSFQDTISLTNTLKIIPGIKLERNPTRGRTDAEFAAVMDSDGFQSGWAAVSRAVRVPSGWIGCDTTRRFGGGDHGRRYATD